MKDDRNLEQLLQQALSPKEEPGYWLNQSILKKAKERESMGKTYKKRIPAAALMAAAVLSIGSLTAVAAWKYLTPDKVAEEVQDMGLAAAFQGEDAISINESQEYGPYKITLLGVVSGENLSKYLTSEHTGEIRRDRTYVVTAIENTDGSPRPDTSEESYGQDPFFVSPLVEGQNPSFFNAVTMSGGYSEFVQDGIQYRITETDNVEVFADRTLYLAVNSGVSYDNGAYQFDAATGEITRNEAYDGVNALFCLPLDESKADKEKADAYIRQLEAELDGTGDAADGTGSGITEENGNEEEPALQSASDESTETFYREVPDFTDWEEEDFRQHAALLEDLTQTLHVDKKGYISYTYQIEEHGVESSNTILAESLFEENQVGMSKVKQAIKGETEQEGMFVEAFTRNEDGTITLKVYNYQEN